MIPLTMDFSDTERYEATTLTEEDILELHRTRLTHISHYARAQGRGWQGRPTPGNPPSSNVLQPHGRGRRRQPIATGSQTPRRERMVT